MTDRYGRDRGLELMTGAIDPDYGEPFLSQFTVQSLRDLGYAITAIEHLRSANAKFVGAVLNKVNFKRNSFYYADYYRQDYGAYHTATAKAASLCSASRSWISMPAGVRLTAV